MVRFAALQSKNFLSLIGKIVMNITNPLTYLFYWYVLIWLLLHLSTKKHECWERSISVARFNTRGCQIGDTGHRTLSQQNFVKLTCKMVKPWQNKRDQTFFNQLSFCHLLLFLEGSALKYSSPLLQHRRRQFKKGTIILSAILLSLFCQGFRNKKYGPHIIH